MLTKYSREFTQKGDANNLLSFDGVTRPTKEESEYHSGTPWRAGCRATFRQLKSQRFGQI